MSVCGPDLTLNTGLSGAAAQEQVSAGAIPTWLHHVPVRSTHAGMGPDPLHMGLAHQDLSSCVGLRIVPILPLQNF